MKELLSRICAELGAVLEDLDVEVCVEGGGEVKVTYYTHPSLLITDGWHRWTKRNGWRPK